MTGQFAGFDRAELLRLIPEAGSRSPEELQARLEAIRRQYSESELAALLWDGVPLPENVRNSAREGKLLKNKKEI